MIIRTNFNNNSPNFGSYEKIKDIKRIPGTKCALCGKDMIMENAVGKAYTAITKPLSTILKKGYMDKWKEKPLIWEILNVYAQLHPKESLDKIVERDEEYMILKRAVVKDVCQKTGTDGNDDPTRKQILDLYNSIMKDSRRELRCASVIMKRFSSFKSFLSGIKLKAFEQLQIYSSEFPHKRLSEIVNMPDIKYMHSKKHSIDKTLIDKKREYHFSNIEKMVKKTNPKALTEIKTAKEKTLQIFRYEKDQEAKIYKAKKIYQEILEKYNCRDLIPKVFKEIEELPSSYSTVDGFFKAANNHNYSDFNIIDSIIAPFVASYEHIVSRYEGGKSRLGNGLALHTMCNKKIGSDPYSEVLKYHPELEENSKAQIDQLSNIILKNNKWNHLRFWPLKASKTLMMHSDGQITPDITEYCEKKIKKLKKALKTAESEKEIININREINILSKWLEGNFK